MLIVIVLPIIGAVLWFFLGRERLVRARLGGGGSVRRGPRAPDDDPDFLRKLSREQAQEERIRDLEEHLRDGDGRSTTTSRRSDRLAGERVRRRRCSVS